MALTPFRSRSIKQAKVGASSFTVSCDFGKSTEYQEIDEHIWANGTPDALRKALMQLPEIPPELRKKLEKRETTFGKHAVQVIANLAEKAIHRIPTLNGYIFNANIAFATKRNWSLGIAATILPWTKFNKKENQYLCIYTEQSFQGLACFLRVARLDIDGDERTVLITDHVCKRITERAGIEGSQVAYIAKSILRAGFAKRQQVGMAEPLLEMVDFNGDLLGYCPVAQTKCGLHGSRDTLGEEYLRFIQDQPRWRLKTFMPREYFKETPDGYLVPRKSSEQ